MSEKIYACLLRLFPSHFREGYGDDALQLFRDRSHDEKGFYPTLRLWVDLLADLAISIPREYRYVQPELIAAAGQRLDGVPAFCVLGNESPGFGALLFGSVASFVALVTFWTLLFHGGNYVRIGTAAAGKLFSDSRSSKEQVPQAKQEDNPGALEGAVVEGKNLDAAARQRVIDGAIANLKDHYIDPDMAKRMADALLDHQKSGDDDGATNGEAFANLLTTQMRDVSHDAHLDLIYSAAPLPDTRSGPTSEDLARYREFLERENCTFERVQILPHNIGYLKLNSFPDPSVCKQTAVAAMARLNDAGAIIFDLRDNRGGEPEMVALMAAYLFDHPEYWYNPRENTTQRSWTQSPVPGNRLANKPVYLLTSRRTFSGAEQFCYDLKMLKRATLVGERTAGAAHAGVFHRIDDHFGMGIPEAKPINPFSNTDWAGTGVEPDVKVEAADALETAKKLAFGRLQKK